MRIVYEVNLEVEPEIAPAFSQWLSPHIQEMIALPGFLGAKNYERQPKDEGSDSKNTFWTVHYYLESRSALEGYFEKHAPRMRADGKSRFGDKFKATRRILELKEDFKEE